MTSKLRPLGRAGLRLEMPTTSQPADKKASMAATPMRPLAPATSTLFFFLPISSLLPLDACWVIRFLLFLPSLSYV